MFVEMPSAKLKDRRVDKVLIQNDYNLEDCIIYYSPIVGLLYYAGIFVAFTSGMILLLVYYACVKFTMFFSFHLVIGYLLSAFLNNSFVITSKELIVINPNFPFKRFEKYDLNRIQKVVMDNSWLILFSWIFLLSSRYVCIIDELKQRKFYCAYLERDAYDENITEKNLDDFQAHLKKLSIKTEMNLD
jgi:hypothetical protein